MKRSVSLKDVLNGNSKKRRLEDRLKLSKTIDEKAENCSSEPIACESNVRHESVENTSLVLRTSKIFPSPASEGNGNSMKSLLMGKKKLNQTGDMKLKKNTVITLNDDKISTQYGDDELTVVEVEHFERTWETKKLADLPDVKRTKVTEILSGSKKSNDTMTSALMSHTPVHRMHPISKLKFVELPMASIHTVEPENTDDSKSGKQNLMLNLHKKNKNETDTIIKFNMDDYKRLRNNVEESNKEYKLLNNPISENHFLSQTSDLWTHALRPHNDKEIILDPELKKRVKEWVTESFVKLKKPTTRNQLKKIAKVDDDIDLSGFIVYSNDSDDEYSPNKVVSQEFVPLMVLHGEGVGKNSLIHVIIDELKGQVYEINSSSNRSKKDILETLVEFSTTHDVKGHGSKRLILLDDVDVLFKEHDKLFWSAVEKVLMISRRPVVVVCRDINFIPTNLLQIVEDQKCCFQARKVSQKTVASFLSAYYKHHDIDIDSKSLHQLIEDNNNDIRKSLNNLQFYCKGSAIYRSLKPAIIKKSISISRLKQVAQYSEIFSITNVLNQVTADKSLITNDYDKTLLSSKVSALHKIEADEQIRLDNDYMVDYRLNLIDTKGQPLADYEFNASTEIAQEASKSSFIGMPPSMIKKNGLNKMTAASMAFMNSKIGANGDSTSLKRTRNSSRKFKDILDGSSIATNSNGLEPPTGFELDTTNHFNLATYYNPYVCEFAKQDQKIKDYNKKVFVERLKETPDLSHTEIVTQLLKERQFRRICFQLDPSLVIKNWSHTTNTNQA